MRPIRRSQSGFTLIEILIALVLLMVGIVGILSLFPVGIKNVNESVKDSNAANITQSLYGAVTEAMRRSDGLTAVVCHDGLPLSGGIPMVSITLPSAVGASELYPDVGKGRPGTDTTLEVYQMGTDTRTINVLNSVQNGVGAGGDPTDPLRQYSFQMEVSKPPESVIVVDTAGTTTDLPLFSVRFVVYRSYFTTVVPAGETHPAQVKEISAFVAGSGD
ncbi:MAG: prepilin-type N-terminal cleavage/methylation domain-containing protein [Candidatus Brocadiae bacterium]|nr:prepilin-type N-terminal cleavage/methylation domain-containing protein [Candidatus Brocadiia bacterium]